MFEYLQGKRILVVAAHPDDELLGQGAAIHRLAGQYGCTCRAVILGEGLTSRAEERDPGQWEEELRRHRACMERAAEIIGYESVGMHDFPDNRFDGVELLDLVKTVEKEKNDFGPQVIFTHHHGDLNIDHRRTFQAVLTAMRPMQDEQARCLITYETPSSTEWQAADDPRPFRPNLYLPVREEDMEAKCAGMEAYTFEKRTYPHPRSAEALRVLARRHGVSAGTPFAEAFTLVRMTAGG